ncbi:DUF6528 family protein [Streptomyces sp. NPDC059009]|uniref:DUF6528 family protein n=1 Tax=Streptomyces sp. NPDC059009 TaxID=3346694 RepID=UPI0036A7A013
MSALMGMRRARVAAAGVVLGGLLAAGCGSGSEGGSGKGGGEGDGAGDGIVARDAEGAAASGLVVVTGGNSQGAARPALLAFDPARATWDPKKDPRSVKWSFDPRKLSAYRDLDPARTWVEGPNEAKFYQLGGKKYVATVAGRGFAAVFEAGTKRRFWGAKLVAGSNAYAYNPHSIELLPTGEVVVASSGDKRGHAYAGRNLCLFPRKVSKGRCVTLPHAHGVSWDSRRNRLWALGNDRLVAYRIDRSAPGRPALVRDHGVVVPWPSGHDLSPVAGKPDRLWVVTGTPVYQYDIGTRKFYGPGQAQSYPGADRISPPPIKGKGGVKAVSSDPLTGRVLRNKAVPGRQTSQTASLHLPDGVRRNLTYGGKPYYFYKARWVTPRDFDH